MIVPRVLSFQKQGWFPIGKHSAVVLHGNIKGSTEELLNITVQYTMDELLRAGKRRRWLHLIQEVYKKKMNIRNVRTIELNIQLQNYWHPW